MAVVSLSEMMEAGAHFGHQTRRWNPKMSKYIYCARNGVHIIDLVKTALCMNNAYKWTRNAAKSGKRFLFVGTKKQASDGLVMYDGVDIKQLHTDDLSRSIGIVLQDVQLFSGSIRENITMGRQDINQDSLISAGKLSGLDDFVSKIPGGYDLQLSDGGKGLSGGQRQSIALARAIVHKPSHFILDEPTSAMDMNAENIFISQMGSIMQDSTMLIVTHRMPLLNLVDRIIVMSEGQIVEDGPKEEIINKLNQPR